MKIFELVELLNNKYSFDLAEDFDNVGLLIGDMYKDVSKVITTLDVDLDVCVEAVENGCNVIVSHHPLFAFDPLKKIEYNTYNGKLVKYIIENNLNIIAMHTNVDNMNGEVSRWIAEDIGLAVKSSFNVVNEKELGVICSYDGTYDGLIEKLRNKYPSIKYIGDNRKVTSVAIVGGSGAFLLNQFVNSDIDVFITGDLKYHDFHDMHKMEKCIVDIGHFAENIFSFKILEGIDVEYVVSKRELFIKN